MMVHCVNKVCFEVLCDSVFVFGFVLFGSWARL